MKSIDELLKEFDEEEEYLKTHPIRRYWRNVLRPFFYNLPDRPRDMYRTIKRGIQRGYRGWADEDTWCLDFYLATVISETIKYLRLNLHGFPSNKDIKSERDWKEILENIEYTFNLSKDMLDQKVIYLTAKQKHNKDSIEYYKKYNCRWLSKDEYNRYLKGWKYFQKYFLNLWD